jgi:hypothetical protein
VPPAVALLNYTSCSILWRIFLPNWDISRGFPIYLLPEGTASCNGRAGGHNTFHSLDSPVERIHQVIVRKIIFPDMFCNLSVNHRDSYICIYGLVYITNILYINIKASKLHLCLLCITLIWSFMGCVNMHNSFICFSLYV